MYFEFIMQRDWIICSIDMLFKEHLRERTIDNLTYYSITLTSSIQKTILLLYALVRGFVISLRRFLGLHFTSEKTFILPKIQRNNENQ